MDQIQLSNIRTFDFAVIGNHPVTVMFSLNLSSKGFNVLILNLLKTKTYPFYLSVPLSAFNLMNIRYIDNKNNFSFDDPFNYIERIYNISRVKNMDNESKNSGIFFDKRQIVSIETQKFSNYLRNKAKTNNIFYQDCLDFKVNSKNKSYQLIITNPLKEKITYLIKSYLINSTEVESRSKYYHQQVIIPELLTDGLDIYLNSQKFPNSHISVFPTKTNTILNLLGKRQVNFDFKDLLNEFLIENYDYNYDNGLNSINTHEIGLVEFPILLFKNNFFLIGSSLSIAHPLSFGYFSAELQTGLVLADVLFEAFIDQSLGDLESLVKRYEIRLLDLPFLHKNNIISGEFFYNLSSKEMEILFKHLNFLDLSNLTLLNKIMLNIKLYFNKNLHDKRKKLKMVYESYKISRKWF